MSDGMRRACSISTARAANCGASRCAVATRSFIEHGEIAVRSCESFAPAVDVHEMSGSAAADRSVTFRKRIAHRNGCRRSPRLGYFEDLAHALFGFAQQRRQHAAEPFGATREH